MSLSVISMWIFSMSITSQSGGLANDVSSNIKGCPFEARYEQVIIRKLLNRQAEQKVITGLLYRDNDGRERNEKYSGHRLGKNVIQVEIYDPVAQIRYLLDGESNSILLKEALTINPERSYLGWRVSDNIVYFIPRNAPDDGNIIGQKQIEGLNCIGSRIYCLEGGIIDYWYSYELMEIVLVQSILGSEERMLRLFDIRRVAPNSDLFVVPPS